MNYQNYEISMTNIFIDDLFWQCLFLEEINENIKVNDIIKLDLLYNEKIKIICEKINNYYKNNTEMHSFNQKLKEKDCYDGIFY